MHVCVQRECGLGRPTCRVGRREKRVCGRGAGAVGFLQKEARERNADISKFQIKKSFSEAAVGFQWNTTKNGIPVGENGK